MIDPNCDLFTDIVQKNVKATARKQAIKTEKNTVVDAGFISCPLQNSVFVVEPRLEYMQEIHTYHAPDQDNQLLPPQYHPPN